MNTIAVSDIIRVAANRCLSDGHSHINDMTAKYSCNAILGLLNDLDMDEHIVKDIIFNAMRECGMSEPNRAHFREFNQLTDKQSARYIWLLFLAEYLEGVVVNVTPAQYRKMKSLMKRYYDSN